MVSDMIFTLPMQNLLNDFFNRFTTIEQEDFIRDLGEAIQTPQVQRAFYDREELRKDLLLNWEKSAFYFFCADNAMTLKDDLAQRFFNLKPEEKKIFQEKFKVFIPEKWKHYDPTMYIQDRAIQKGAPEPDKPASGSASRAGASTGKSNKRSKPKPSRSASAKSASSNARDEKSSFKSASSNARGETNSNDTKTEKEMQDKIKKLKAQLAAEKIRKLKAKLAEFNADAASEQSAPNGQPPKEPFRPSASAKKSKTKSNSAKEKSKFQFFKSR